MSGTEPAQEWAVVINGEEQYSVWPADGPALVGWREIGRHGTREECLEHIAEVWTDMRPLSLRKRLGEQA
ncbi:MbtH family NRPS accessory protein [Streptomyces sp. RPA4-5]|uniref:MbtH family protein n=1 Tax=Streptomyces sp. RPA4-5 TaxID=2721245 RepID=UPI00143EBF4C|nr:MbtH family NRPS accessory protein [Streptomyces sp. RPA4-5]QIY54443.1 MbtH family NRPS accessory protein [Streptomyces sp. RPA4-5]